MEKLIAARRALTLLALVALLVYAGYWNPEVIAAFSGGGVA